MLYTLILLTYHSYSELRVPLGRAAVASANTHHPPEYIHVLRFVLRMVLRYTSGPSLADRALHNPVKVAAQRATRIVKERARPARRVEALVCAYRMP
jgi:hypothetical protein